MYNSGVSTSSPKKLVTRGLSFQQTMPCNYPQSSVVDCHQENDPNTLHYPFESARYIWCIFLRLEKMAGALWFWLWFINCRFCGRSVLIWLSSLCPFHQFFVTKNGRYWQYCYGPRHQCSKSIQKCSIHSRSLGDKQSAYCPQRRKHHPPSKPSGHDHYHYYLNAYILARHMAFNNNQRKVIHLIIVFVFPLIEGKLVGLWAIRVHFSKKKSRTKKD